jgi:3-hydroxy-3-methylglutaryl CoA synthase/uncharacterized OB-fold protein
MAVAVTGLTSYSIYVPRHRLPRELLAQVWGGRPAPGAKAVTGYDEDTVTMGYLAARGLGEFDRLLFASTSAPFWQRSSAAQIAAACDCAPAVATADFGGCLRAGTAALGAALDAVAAGTAERVAVVAAEQRDAEPESPEEVLFGDAAAGVAVGRENVVAELLGRASRTSDFLDEWRRDIDATVSSYPSRFSTRHGYEENVIAAARDALGGHTVTRAVLATPDGKAQAGVARALGLKPEQVEDPRLADVGIAGAAQPLLLLAYALDRAAEGDLILLAGYGDGADAFLFRVTGAIAAHPRLRPDPHVIPYASYPRWRRLREYLRTNTAGPEVSNVFYRREAGMNVRFHGTFCPACGLLQFPIAPVCEGCRNAAGLEERPLARNGRLFTFNQDYLYDAPVQPNVLCVVDLDGGGRVMCQMTDYDGRVEIGMPVEIVLRRMRSSPRQHHYYWKCRPA